MSWDIAFNDMASPLNEFFCVCADHQHEKMPWDIFNKDMASLYNEFFGVFWVAFFSKCLWNILDKVDSHTKIFNLSSKTSKVEEIFTKKMGGSLVNNNDIWLPHGVII